MIRAAPWRLHYAGSATTTFARPEARTSTSERCHLTPYEPSTSRLQTRRSRCLAIRSDLGHLAIIGAIAAAVTTLAVGSIGTLESCARAQSRRSRTRSRQSPDQRRAEKLAREYRDLRSAMSRHGYVCTLWAVLTGSRRTRAVVRARWIQRRRVGVRGDLLCATAHAARCGTRRLVRSYPPRRVWPPLTEPAIPHHPCRPQAGDGTERVERDVMDE